jgi:hypothetical protein
MSVIALTAGRVAALDGTVLLAFPFNQGRA